MSFDSVHFFVFFLIAVLILFLCIKNKDGMVISLQLLFLYVLECKECIITGIYHIMHLYGRAAFREYKRRKNEKMDDCRLL